MTYSMEALGWTLVHFCWQAAAIALLYRIADLALAKTRSNIRYGLALGAMLSMLTVAVVTLGYEEMRARNDGSVKNVAGPGVAQKVQSALVSTPRSDPGFASQPELRTILAANLERLLPWLDGLWLLGVLALSFRTVGGWWLVQRLRRTALALPPQIAAMSFAGLCGRMGIRRAVDLRVSERISGPLAMGVFRSLILLPASALTALSVEQLEVVLAHELAHIRRADYLWNIVQTMIETLFFFHPAVWWVSNNLRQQRELCCDDAALTCCSDPLVYATALLRLEEQRSSRLNLAMALDGHGSPSGLRVRILRMLGEVPQARREIAPLSVLGMCAAIGVFLLPLPKVFASLNHEAQQAGPKIEAAVVALTSPAPKVMVAPEPVARPVVAASPVAAIARTPHVETVVRIAIARNIAPQITSSNPTTTTTTNTTNEAATDSAKGDYIGEMRAAGYGVDLDKLIAMKIQGITPQYAQSMSAIGFGKPTADELLSLKIFGVIPESLKDLKASGIEPTSFQDLISYRIFKVTPEFVAGMKRAGFTSIPPKKLVALRVQGVIPEYARQVKQQFPDVTLDQLVELRIFHIDDAFMAAAKSHGFDHLTIDKLVKLRISGLLDEDNQRSEKK